MRSWMLGVGLELLRSVFISQKSLFFGLSEMRILFVNYGVQRGTAVSGRKMCYDIS